MAAGAREFALGGGLPAQRFALGRIGSMRQPDFLEMQPMLRVGVGTPRRFP
jgi:hypothetical protein